MATSPAVDDALTLLRQRRLALYEASRVRNYALSHNVHVGIPEMNDRIVVARAAWLAARAAVVAALLELESPPTGP